MRDNLDRGGGL